MLLQCVKCKRLRSKEQHQIMGVLPEDRLKVEPPFSNIGVDVFGPWEVITRKTRGGAANSKRWAVLFTCLSTRAVHIEVLESMSTSSFINAFRRLVALRGKVNIIRSDQATNFIVNSTANRPRRITGDERVSDNGKPILITNSTTIFF